MVVDFGQGMKRKYAREVLEGEPRFLSDNADFSPQAVIARENRFRQVDVQSTNQKISMVAPF